MAVYKHGAVWYYCFNVGGKRIRRTTKATTKREAEQESVRALIGMKEKVAIGISLEEAIMRTYNEEWQYHKSGLKMVNRTLSIVKILGNIPLRQVDEDEIAKMVEFLTKQGLSQSSINRYRAYHAES